MPRFHHVNLAVAPDDIPAEITWIVTMLGYRDLQPGEESGPSGRLWFEDDGGAQVHLSTEAGHTPAASGHVALVMEDLELVAGRLAAGGVAMTRNETAERSVILCRDPAGHLWELRSA